MNSGKLFKRTGGPYGTIFATFSCHPRQKCSVSSSSCEECFKSRGFIDRPARSWPSLGTAGSAFPRGSSKCGSFQILATTPHDLCQALKFSDQGWVVACEATIVACFPIFRVVRSYSQKRSSHLAVVQFGHADASCTAARFAAPHRHPTRNDVYQLILCHLDNEMRR